MNTDMVTQLIPGHGLKLKGRELQNYITAEVKRMRAGKKDYHLNIPAGWEKSEHTIKDIIIEEFRTTSQSISFCCSSMVAVIPVPCTISGESARSCRHPLLMPKPRIV